MTHQNNVSKLTPAPNPAQVAAQHATTTARDQERERVKVVRKRRRLRKGATITTHISDETAAALAKLAHPDLGATCSPCGGVKTTTGTVRDEL